MKFNQSWHLKKFLFMMFVLNLCSVGATSFVQDFRFVYSLNKRLKNGEVKLEDVEWKDLYKKMQVNKTQSRERGGFKGDTCRG